MKGYSFLWWMFWSWREFRCRMSIVGHRHNQMFCCCDRCHITDELLADMPEWARVVK